MVSPCYLQSKPDPQVYVEHYLSRLLVLTGKRYVVATVPALVSALEEITGQRWRRHEGREAILAKFKGRRGYQEKAKSRG